ncbi:unnamed protein product [Dovyalis caffra]|uniref:Uncharacterized protein n=1 Tax=Dovyalis caffra TaxID=77055 RepID=A0AAV1QRA8_9ROSI|nr:unnamed protein product [Dovyalis caffra]
MYPFGSSWDVFTTAARPAKACDLASPAFSIFRSVGVVATRPALWPFWASSIRGYAQLRDCAFVPATTSWFGCPVAAFSATARGLIELWVSLLLWFSFFGLVAAPLAWLHGLGLRSDRGGILLFGPNYRRP